MPQVKSPGQVARSLSARLWLGFHACYAPCVTVGGVLAAVCYLVLQKDPWWEFLIGFAATIWPVQSRLQNPDRLRGLMETAREWQQAGHITQSDLRQFHREVLELFKHIAVGVPPPVPSSAPSTDPPDDRSRGE